MKRASTSIHREIEGKIKIFNSKVMQEVRSIPPFTVFYEIENI